MAASHLRSTSTQLRAPAFWTLVGGVSLIGSALLVPSIGANIALVDMALVLVIGYWIHTLGRSEESPERGLLRSAAPWFLLIAFATVVALFGVGIPSWALLHIAQSVFAFTVFFAAYRLFWERRADLRIFRTVVIIGVVLAVVALAVETGDNDRAAGTFPNPNYAANFLVASLIVVWGGIRTLPRRLVLCGIVGIGLVLSASFGGLLMLAVALGYHVLRLLTLRTLVFVGTACAVLVLVIVTFDRAPDISFESIEITPTLSAQRFDRSGSGRLDLWEAATASFVRDPLGTGPDGIRALELVDRGKEAHNSYVAYLVERGPLGLLGLLGLGVAFWRHSQPGSTARTLILAFAVANLVRETLHYRHLWLLLALAYVADAVPRSNASPEDEAENETEHEMANEAGNTNNHSAAPQLGTRSRALVAT